MTIGLSIGLGGVGAPLLGLLADNHGLRAVFELIAVFPIIALALAQLLPARAPVDEVPDDPRATAAPEPASGHSQARS